MRKIFWPRSEPRSSGGRTPRQNENARFRALLFPDHRDNVVVRQAAQSQGRAFTLNLREELKAVDDPYNTVVEDAAKGRRIEEVRRLYYQRKFSVRNPGNIDYEEILNRVRQDFSEREFADLTDVNVVTGNLAHGNGFGATKKFREVCNKRGIQLPPNDVFKAEGINSFNDIQEIVKEIQAGQAAPVDVTRDSDILDGNFVWTRTCRGTFLKWCSEISAFLVKKIQLLS